MQLGHGVVAAFVRVTAISLAIAGAMLSTGTGHADVGAPADDAATIRESVRLPRVLSTFDEDLYRRIFALGEEGQWHGVDSLVAQVNDRLLLGHVLAQRYLHPTAHRSRYDELQAWLAAYADHPDAEGVRKLALLRKPKDAPGPAPVASPEAIAGGSWAPRRTVAKVPPRRLDPSDTRRASLFKRRIRSQLRRGSTLAAKHVILSAEAGRLLSPAELDEARAALGHAYFVDGRDAWALEWCAQALERSGRYLPEADWTAGLANWRLGRYAAASGHFEAVARRSDVSPWLASAAAFWSARSHLFARQPDQVNRWLGTAESYPRTFYGILAGRVLGLPGPLRWEYTVAERRALQTLTALPAGRRALALTEVGQTDRAERELRALAAAGGANLARGIMAAAELAGMPALAIHLHRKLFDDGIGFAAAAYPVPPWRPEGGFRVDRALIFALIRQESRFDPDAKNDTGASGLMQLMPSTARYVAEGNGRAMPGERHLLDPGLNLTLGQRYLQTLLGDGRVRGDLLRLAAAWNGGPGNLQKWHSKLEHRDDPLLFIEAIPSPETRIFIERTLANLWIYRQRMGQPSPSLDALAAGQWPVYTPLDHQGVEVARHGKD